MAKAKSQSVEMGASGFNPVILLLFVGSGCSAIIYEVIWFHLLRLVIGATAISLAVLLACFMGGMCLGSLAYPWLVSRRRHPLRVYAALEAGIGILGIVLLFLLPQLGKFYLSFVGHGSANILLRATVSGISLLPPAMLMGATLPAITRWLETTPAGISRMGLLYGANIGGAVLGTLLAGFYLMPVFDIHVTTYVAAALNAVVAVAAIILAGRKRFLAPPPEAPSLGPPAHPIAYLVIGLSGFTALGAEVVWARILSLVFGATVYTFSLILAVFLAGLGIGSHVGSYLAQRTARPLLALAWCQFLLVAWIAWGSYGSTQLVPFIQAIAVYQPWILAEHFVIHIHNIAVCAFMLLPATILWGASFPLALACAGLGSPDPGRLVGRVYAANTLGAILGALIFSLLIIPGLGTQGAQQTLALVAACSAAIMFVADRAASASEAGPDALRQRLPGWAFSVLGLIALGGAGLMAWAIPPTPAALVAYGRQIYYWDDIGELLYLREGTTASVAVTESHDGVRSFHVSGKIVASSLVNDMRLQRMLGSLPALLHPDPRSVLVVGCGAGVTAGSFTAHKEIRDIVLCEIEPLVIQGARDNFAVQNRAVFSDPRFRIVLDDARHFMSTTDEMFDIISSDPTHPWVRGAAPLFTTEYYELCKKRLRPNGTMVQWLPYYETSEAAVKSAMATFVKAFPYTTVWNSEINLQGYDVVMIGGTTPVRADLRTVIKRLELRPEVKQMMTEVHLGTTEQLLLTYMGKGADLAPWFADAQINQDRSLRLQYLAGAAIGVDYRDEIYDVVMQYLRNSEELFPPKENLEARKPGEPAANGAQ